MVDDTLRANIILNKETSKRRFEERLLKLK
jgi:hypothetical protein